MVCAFDSHQIWSEKTYVYVFSVCMYVCIKAIHSLKLFVFNITSEAVVGPIIMLGAR